MARTPPGRTILAMVANRWMASTSRCIIDTDASTMRVSHKTARTDPFTRRFANRHGQANDLEATIDSARFHYAASVILLVRRITRA